MEIKFLLKGIIIGILIAAPIGPINVLCIKRTLDQGRLAGFISGFGAACADTVYGCIAAFGLTAVTNMFLQHQKIFRIVGGIFLVYIGVKTALSAVPKTSDIANNKKKGVVYNFTTTFALTLTNPLTILAFTAIFAAIGLNVGVKSHIHALVLIMGVFSGSLLWWIMVTIGSGMVRVKLTEDKLKWINRVAGIIIFVFGILAFLSLLQRTN